MCLHHNVLTFDYNKQSKAQQNKPFSHPSIKLLFDMLMNRINKILEVQVISYRYTSFYIQTQCQQRKKENLNNIVQP